MSEREHVLSGDCWCNPRRERWDEESLQWVEVKS